MPRATCRCGQTLSFPVNGPERVVCPKCSARIRVRRDGPGDGEGEGDGDGFARFSCPCGRRLKVRAGGDAPGPQAGKCPDCGRVVPVPAEVLAGGRSPSSSGLKLKSMGADPESPTQELSAEDIAVLGRWSEGHAAPPTPEAPAPPPAKNGSPQSTVDHDPAPAVAAPAVKTEAGLRVCPRCGRPVHLSALACRECGAHVPKR